MTIDEEFDTPQTLLIRTQRVEFDDTILDPRKRECTVTTLVASVTPPPHSISTYKTSYPPLLMSTLYSAPFAPSYNTISSFCSSFPSQSSLYHYFSSSVADSSMLAGSAPALSSKLSVSNIILLKVILLVELIGFTLAGYILSLNVTPPPSIIRIFILILVSLPRPLLLKD
jgi:hypothetical protein